MIAVPAALVRNQQLDVARDFYELRRRGIGFVSEMGSAQWTDYNVHDPGITILEAAAYALTDIAYRMSWDITDILMPAAPPADPARPYPGQAFFTAREILTVNPTTPEDFRRLLIDLDGVRNAWILCKRCACETAYHAWCDRDADALVLGFAPPEDRAEEAREVFAEGLYEALLELEGDPDLGDLNDRKIVHEFTFRDGSGTHPVIMELRFPDVSLVAWEAWARYLEDDATFGDPAGFTVTLARLGATKDFDVFAGFATAAERDAYIRRNWRNVFYLDLRVAAAGGAAVLEIANAALRVFGGAAAKNGATAAGWRALFEDSAAAGVVARYRRKAKAAAAAIAAAKGALRACRNLDEDYCSVRGVAVEEVAVCADVEVEPGADIERVQAEIWFRLGLHLNPPVPFRSLRELREGGVPVEDIFDGPALANGFITAEDLEAAVLRRRIAVSDVLNLLMDIEGVVAVNGLLLTKYDAAGEVATGAADPQWSSGEPIFDPARASAQWLLFVSPGHQPRLYLNQSRFRFYKNGLPFTPRMDEATSVLSALVGASAPARIPAVGNDIPIPAGAYRDPESFYPIQYSLPPAYGVGPAGLSSTASRERRAQAHNLKAYLMVYEQIIGDALAQFAHSAELFSLDASVARTYFVKAFDAAAISGFDEIGSGLTAAAVEALAETEPEFLARRNLFLDHLLARFGESFGEYALLLTGVDGEKVARRKLIANKIAFLRRYPRVSRDRGKSFDHGLPPGAEGHDSGVKTRVMLLLGQPDLVFAWQAVAAGGGGFAVGFRLIDGQGTPVLEGSVTRGEADADAAIRAAYRAVLALMVDAAAYEIEAVGSRWRLRLLDPAATEIAASPQVFDEPETAAALRDDLLAWSAMKRLVVVEHLLLRPKFPGDALYPACCEGGCCACGEEDPYSFRLTYVMPGWMGQFTGNLDLRRFADRTIRQETPSHLLAKICWVGNDGLLGSPCDGVVERIAALLEDAGAPDNACGCASEIYDRFAAVFRAWRDDQTLVFLHRDALEARVAALFADGPDPPDCATVLDAPRWAEATAMMADHFVGIAATGWQFERFEEAWERWLGADAAIDWTEERLQARLEALLGARLLTTAPLEGAVCRCARAILVAYGETFSAWLDGEIRAGTPPEDLGEPPQPVVAPCAGLAFAAGTAEAVSAFLLARYGRYREVSYRLRVVVTLLSELNNTYPGATLHDCDDGSDHNPVRLGSTALGNYPSRMTLT
jgi:hypothetical protein